MDFAGIPRLDDIDEAEVSTWEGRYTACDQEEVGHVDAFGTRIAPTPCSSPGTLGVERLRDRWGMLVGDDGGGDHDRVMVQCAV